MQFLHLKVACKICVPVAVVAEEFMRCLYMHSTFPWSCTAETLLFVQPVLNVFWSVYNHQDPIARAYTGRIVIYKRNDFPGITEGYFW